MHRSGAKKTGPEAVALRYKDLTRVALKKNGRGRKDGSELKSTAYSF